MVLAEGSYKCSGRGGGSRSLRLIDAKFQYRGEGGKCASVRYMSSPADRGPPPPFIGQGEAVHNRAAQF
jgi:hypothetical protein